MEEGPLNQSQMIRVWTLVCIRVLLVLAAFFAALWVIYTLSTVLLLLVLSIFFCYLIAPLVRVFEQAVYVRGREIKLPRGVAIAAVYVVIGAALFLLSWLIWPFLQQQVRDLADTLPEYLTSGSGTVKRTFEDADSWLRRLNLPESWRESLVNQTAKMAEFIFQLMSNLVTGVVSSLAYLPWLIVVPIMSFFLLKDAESFEQSIVALMPDRLQKRVHWLLLDVSNTLAAYIRAQIKACVVVGGLVTAGLGLMNVRYALVLGLIAGILEFVPLVGPLLAAAIIFGLTLTYSLKMALWAMLFLAVLRVVHDYIIYPRIVGQGIKIHPLIVVLAILAGEQIGGLAGIFLAIPFVGLVIVVYNHYLAYRSLQALREERLEREADIEALTPEVSHSGASPPVLEK
ncbi:MAG: AI-2E family transporter [Blastocatellia bacterium]|nr:AI-2E family transporter [Blastocatellia bacterium]